ncbi:MAG: GntR family transcriptional regulator [Sphingomonas bacterium]|nr:GntR family transcriptional regulator [Sphingomonas bacterium]
MRALSLHARIRADIERRILDGALAPGDRLPVEHELTRDYGCSRMTVSKALSSLADAGLIERRRKAGSFVARPRVHSMVLDIPDLEAVITARGQRYDFMLLMRIVRQPVDNEYDLAGAGALLELEGLHSADGVPLALEHRLIGLAAVPDSVTVDFGAVSPGAWLLRHVPWTQAETRIAAEAADGATARHLALPTGAPCLVIERRTWRGEVPVTRVRQSFVGAAYDLVARFGHGAIGIST